MVVYHAPLNIHNEFSNYQFNNMAGLTYEIVSVFIEKTFTYIIKIKKY